MPRAATAFAILLFSLTTACASSGAQPERGGTGRPPVMESTLRPQWRVAERPVSGRVLDMTVTVQIDADGTPDMKTLRVAGLGSIENQDVVEEWIRQAKFKPAVREGVNVPGVYRQRFQVQTQVRRM